MKEVAHVLLLLPFATAVHEAPAVKLHSGVANVPPPQLDSNAWPPAPPYSHTVKELGNTKDAAACRKACVEYRNTETSPVSGWTLCQSFTWFSTGRCVAVVDPTYWTPVKTDGAITGALTWPARKCSSDSDCSYNGNCKDNLCVCRAAWKGDKCQTLNLLPTTRGAGLRAVDDGRNTSSWGGGILRDEKTGIFHMWASEMLQHCGIDSWTTNSHIIHATSKTVEGPYERQEEVVPAFAHEPNVARAPTGEWVMYYTASDPDATPAPVCDQCTDGRTPAAAPCAHSAGGTAPTYMSWAPGPDGPWSKPELLFKAERSQTNMDTNLAVVILQNGSVTGIGRTGGKPTGIVTHLVTAAHWKDASSYTGRWDTMLFPNTTILPESGVEDPFVYTEEGIFHAVFHNQIEMDDEKLCGGHAYSTDGITWTFTGTSWGNTVHFQDGSSYSFSRMERPHIVFDNAGKALGLSVGVQFGSGAPISVPGEDACYTLFQPVETNSADVVMHV